MGATDIPACGSLPLIHHSGNMTPNATSGKKMIGLLPRNQSALVNGPGDSSTPLGRKISAVSPPRAGKGIWKINWLQVMDKGNNLRVYYQDNPLLRNAVVNVR